MQTATESSILSIYRIDAEDGHLSSSSPSPLAATAAAVYDATDDNQVNVTMNQLSVDLPAHVATSLGVYTVLLQSGNLSISFFLQMPKLVHATV